jgi:putative copper resistance protein D
MLGSLVLALWALPAGQRGFDTALDTASISAAIFTLASAATGFLTFVNTMNAVPSADAVFGQQLGRFLVEVELGRAWLITTIAGAVLTVLTFAVRSWTPTLFVALLAIVALVPMGTRVKRPTTPSPSRRSSCTSSRRRSGWAASSSSWWCAPCSRRAR